MTRIVDLVAPGGIEEFLGTTWGRQARRFPGADDRFTHLLPWHALNELLRRHRLQQPRLRLARDGQRVPIEEYATLVTPRRGEPYQRLDPGALGDCLRDGATLVIDSIDELYGPIDDLAADIERTLRERTQVNLYASFGPTRGFQTHWDDHDVLVVQVHGSKHWRVFGPTRTHPTRRDVDQPEPPTGQPQLDLMLTAGDVLHVPRGWWHDASATEGASLHLTFGINTRTGADLVAWLADDLRRHEIARMDLPRFAGEEARAQRIKEIAELVAARFSDPHLLREFFDDADALAPPRAWAGLPVSVRDEIPADGGRLVVLQAPRARLREDAETVTLTANGLTLTFAAAAGPVLRALVDGHARAVDDLATTSNLSADTVRALTAELIREGLATTLPAR